MIPREMMAQTSSRRDLWLALAPSFLAVLMSMPGLTIPFLFDDFDFLARAQTFSLAHLLPDPRTAFYRPIPRDLYFALVYSLSHAGSLVLSHAANALLLAITVWLFTSFAQSVAGREAGFYAGVAFACMAQLPILVAWVSGIQDLLAILFIVMALHLQLRGRRGLAVIAAICSILSKETVAVLFPALIYTDVAVGRRPLKFRAALPYVLVLSVWALVHPGVHILVTRAAMGIAGGYIATTNPDFLGALAKTTFTMANFPVSGVHTQWQRELTPLLPVAVAIIFLAATHLGPRNALKGPMDRSPLVLGGLLALPPVLLTTMLVPMWAPYYSCIPSLGSSIVLGWWARKTPRVLSSFIVVLFLLAGLWARGAILDPSITTERNLRHVGLALNRIEGRFKRLCPKLPHPSQVLLATEARGTSSIYVHMYRFQALRVWYRDPDIVTLHPDLRKSLPGAEMLFFITPDQSICQIELPELDAKCSDGPLPRAFYEKTLRLYAMGLSTSGRPTQSTGILLGMKAEDAATSAFNRRLAAMLLLANSRFAEAEHLLQSTPLFSEEDAVNILRTLLTSPGMRRIPDEIAFRAFGFHPDNEPALRYVMHWFSTFGYKDIAARFAHRLLAIRPDDVAASEILRERGTAPPTDLLTTPVEADSD